MSLYALNRIFNHFRRTARPVVTVLRCETSTYSTQHTPVKDDLDQPPAFLGSQAAKWKAATTRTGVINENVFWFEPYVVLFSTFVFMVYFCVLREENDIDAIIGESLFDKVPGLEKSQLLAALKHNKQKGLDCSMIENRLSEIAAEEVKAAEIS